MRRHGAAGAPAARDGHEARDGHDRHHPPAGGSRRGLIWTGSISFGLVNIPVSLRSAESAKELHFTMLDRRDLSPVGYRKINKATGQDVPSDQIVKGYKLGEDEYVTLSDEDFKRASPERTQRIDIQAFVDRGAIDPALYERPYYLEPAAKSEKAYALLREAMRRSGKTGIATVVLRAREYLAALLVHGNVLTLELLRYASELRDPSDLRVPEADSKRLRVTEAELKMAQRLIDDLSAPWEPEKYKDQYRDELLAFIEEKAKAGKTEVGAHPAEKPRRAAPPADLMGLLKKSLAKR